MANKKDLMLTDVAEIIKAFYKDVEDIGTTDAVINVIDKAYKAGREHGRAEA